MAYQQIRPTGGAQAERRNLANAIRALSMDAVQQARSGHPGMPMGMADIAEVLWNDFLRHNPGNPRWPDRDRFVVSNGHGSMLLYSLLHLTGYPLPIDEVRNFRQFGARTAGHPEYEPDLGIETTTGPLGQGLANAVGMALAERRLAAHFNRPGFDLVDHWTYVFTGDGCLMEGISHEACSLAGTLGLGRLIVFYDDNGISIDGDVRGWFTDNTVQRFESYGWQVIPAVDGHDAAAIRAAIEAARADTARPTLICCRTVIGFGAPNKQGTAATHGAALGTDEVAAAREHLQWPHAPFEIPDDVYAGWDARKRGAALESQWRERLTAYTREHPQLAQEFERWLDGRLPADWNDWAAALIAQTDAQAGGHATRKASQLTLDALGGVLPELLGGSADLAGSNLTIHKHSQPISAESYDGNYVFYGVREFGMAAVANGLALHGGAIPYSGTFLVFSDYARNALRMAALMRQRNIFVLTHDSIGLGEDGPTHQPIEHLASLRLIPNLDVWRPCDGVETAVAWVAAIERTDGPSALALSRQNLPHQPRTAEQLAAIRQGGYTLVAESAAQPDLVLIATGSEVPLAVAAAAKLAEAGIAARVVSMPCTSLFDAQPASYRQQVLPPGVPRLAVEAGVTQFWRAYVGDAGDVIGLDRYGESAPAEILFEHFGFTVENVVNRARSQIGR